MNAPLVRVPNHLTGKVQRFGGHLVPITEGRWAGRYLGPSWLVALIVLIERATQETTIWDSHADERKNHEENPVWGMNWDQMLKDLAEDQEKAFAVATLAQLAVEKYDKDVWDGKRATSQMLLADNPDEAGEEDNEDGPPQATLVTVFADAIKHVYVIPRYPPRRKNKRHKNPVADDLSSEPEPL